MIVGRRLGRLPLSGWVGYLGKENYGGVCYFGLVWVWLGWDWTSCGGLKIP